MDKSQSSDSRFCGTNVLLLDCSTIQCLPMMKAFHELGCTVTTVSLSRLDVGAVSRYSDRRIIIPVKAFRESEYITHLIQVLEQRHYDLVLPLADSTTRALSRHKADLSRYAYIAAEDWSVLQAVDDKLATMIVCMENDIPCPKTLPKSDTLDDVLSAVETYPVALKPRVGCGGEGFSKISSREDLIETFSATVQKYGPVLVQEYIPQCGTQYQCVIYVGRDRKVKSAVIYNKPRWYPVSGGSSCCNVTIDRPDLIGICVRLLEKLNFTGYADLDLIEDPRDGSVKIFEINPRITGSVKIAFLAGVDFARQILEDALELPVTVYTAYRKDVVIRRFLVDVLWFFQSPRRFKTKPSWFKFWNFSDEVFSWNDPLPGIAYLFKPIRNLCRRCRP